MMEWFAVVASGLALLVGGWASLKNSRTTARAQDTAERRSPLEISDLVTEVSRKAVALAAETYEARIMHLEARIALLEAELATQKDLRMKLRDRVDTLEQFIADNGHDPAAI